jgi:uncharacterized membrane protein YhiD involved in acid resistance
VTQGEAEAVHVLIAAGLTYALGFERSVRGASAGDRVFALVGVAAGIVGVFAVQGAPNALQGALTGIWSRPISAPGQPRHSGRLA